ncbi:MAG TPA: hypothetical protein VHT53_06435 [Candidatus Elarobacter sp.]|jgi:hypothetical protein|nr:hypothetical protein [Candidatus Elarobacter sp.]
MEAVVAVIIRDSERGETALLTWGRLYHPVDPSELLATIRRVLPTMGFGAEPELTLCDTLGEASDFAYFHEGLITFASVLASQRKWRAEFQAALRDDAGFSKALYLLGPRISRH